MEQKAKLVTCQVNLNQQRRFIIYNNQCLGSGAFGIVKRAHQENLQSMELAVKIVPYDNQQSRQKIDRQVQMIKQLPDHPNLVKVLPLKCYSEKNYYIFMEYCNQGTLQGRIKQKVKNRQSFTQEQIFEAFYQILSGYKVLYQKKILHQDLKPDNILIKNGVYKITDFGFSIFHEGVKMTRQRQGTFPYMPLEKLTVANYLASTKSDVYALGVIFFKMITGRHPYVLTQFQNHKQYIDQLKIAQLTVPNFIKARMSPPMQHLFDLVLRMCAKKESQRADFKQIYEFIAQQEMFLKFSQLRQKQSEVISQSVEIKKDKNIHFVECSSAFAIPFSIPITQQQQYLKQLKNLKQLTNQKKQIQAIYKIQRYLCSMRLMVYFFDRLSRKLIVQKMIKQKDKQINVDADIQQKTILALLYLSTKITTQTLEQSKFNRVFSVEQWKLYKKTDPIMLKILKKDQQYLKLLINETLMSTKQSKIAERHQIIEKSKKSLSYFMKEEVKLRLFQILQTRNTWISMNDKKNLTTLNYIITAIEIIDNFQNKKQQWQALESYFRQIQIGQALQLFQKVTKGLKELGISYSIDQGDQEGQEEQKRQKK